MNKVFSFLTSRVFIYALKCIAGFSATYALYLYFPQHQFFWSVVAVLLVLAPDAQGANTLAVQRIQANIIGAGTGLLISFLHEPLYTSVTLGIVLTILVCTFFKLTDVTRTALAALVIVTLRADPVAPWKTSLERMGCVLVGCLIGLIITFLFHAPLKRCVHE